MPSAFTNLTIVSFDVAGALTVGITPKRVVVPFAFELAGVTATVNTPSTVSSIIFDVLAGPNNTAPATLVSVFKTIANRPTIAAGNNDQSPTVAPFNPAIARDTAVEPSETEYFVRPDPTTATTFAGNQPVSTTQPANVVVNPTEGGTLNQPQPQANIGYIGASGTALQLSVVQIGTVAGSDARVILLLLQR